MTQPALWSVQRHMRWIAVFLVGCSSAVGFGDAGSAKDSSAPPKDSAVAQDAQDDAQDSGTPADSGQPAQDSGQPPIDSGPAPDSGTPDTGTPDSGVQGKCFIPNGGAFTCMVNPPLLFRVTDPDGGASVQCDQINLVCPVGWACKLVSNGKTGTCIP